MAAPKGNEFWKLRSKHGREKLFKTPELLWEAACEYFEWCVENPIEKQDFVGKDADEVYRKLERPFTLQGLCIYCDASSTYWKEFKSNCREKSKDFLPVITRIEEVIYNQKFEGAAVGIFNNNIIARDLGLKDSHDVDVKEVKEVTGYRFADGTVMDATK